MTLPRDPWPESFFLDRSDRTRVEVRGPDRAKFLHNLTTNEVKRLPVGQGKEAFVTSPQGKTLGYVILLAADDHILLRADPGGLVHVLPHLQKYGIFDDVTIEDVGTRTFEFHVAGPAAEEVVRRSGGTPPDGGELGHGSTTVVGREVRVVREAPAGRPGFTFLGRIEDAPAVASALHEVGSPHGLLDLEPAAFDALRIEAGTPVFGRDLSADNLPQEVGRDSVAINFVKGCYLGQETVARIDALGHVNKLLRGLTFRGRHVPAPGSVIEAGGKSVGVVTSSAFSRSRGCPVALGYVRASISAGTEVVVSPQGEGAQEVATVRDLPMPLV